MCPMTNANAVDRLAQSYNWSFSIVNLLDRGGASVKVMSCGRVMDGRQAARRGWDSSTSSLTDQSLKSGHASCLTLRTTHYHYLLLSPQFYVHCPFSESTWAPVSYCCSLPHHLHLRAYVLPTCTTQPTTTPLSLSLSLTLDIMASRKKVLLKVEK